MWAQLLFKVVDLHRVDVGEALRISHAGRSRVAARSATRMPWGRGGPTLAFEATPRSLSRDRAQEAHAAHERAQLAS